MRGNLNAYNRWFAMADLGFALAAGAAISLWPQTGGWPLLLVLLPLGARIATGGFPLRRTLFLERTPFDLPLAIFLATAGVGIWAAYDPAAAWAKFWVIVSAAVFFYAVAAQPAENLWVVAGLLGLMGSLLAVWFLLGGDWTELRADLAFIGRLGRWWMSVRPESGVSPIPPNLAGGLLALLLPFPLAFGLGTLRLGWKAGGLTLLFACLASGLAGIALLMTSSRGAWLALATGAGAWSIWGISSLLSRRLGLPRGALFGLAATAAALLLLSLVRAYPGGILGLADRLPGNPSGVSRLDLAHSTLELTGDFPFTGGGLHSFAGLYSQYILDIPFFMFGYAHNFYLDVALEQGWLGFAALAAIYLLAAWLLVRCGGTSFDRLRMQSFDRLRMQSFDKPFDEPFDKLRAGLRMQSLERQVIDSELLAGAAIASLGVALLHGLVDDALYGERGTFLLLLLPGIAAALSRTCPSVAAGTSRRTVRRKLSALGLLGCATALAAILIAGWPPARSAWEANLGAVSMSHVELAGFPIGKWNSTSIVPALDPARARFEHLLLRDPKNSTALHRLGLIARLEQDFPAAVSYLEAAYRLDPNHRGIRKVLGFAYLWAGQPDRALALLQGLREAERELHAYRIWWEGQGRLDLALAARRMEGLLKERR